LSNATRPASASFGSKRECIEDSANLPPPDIIAAESVEGRRAALEQFAEIAGDLGSREALE
jgi:type I restriction enzyme M protein